MSSVEVRGCMEASLERSEVQNDINSSKYPRHRFLDTGILSTSIQHKGLVVIQVELRGCMEASVQRSGLHDIINSIRYPSGYLIIGYRDTIHEGPVSTIWSGS